MRAALILSLALLPLLGFACAEGLTPETDPGDNPGDPGATASSGAGASTGSMTAGSGTTSTATGMGGAGSGAGPGAGGAGAGAGPGAGGAGAGAGPGSGGAGPGSGGAGTGASGAGGSGAGSGAGGAGGGPLGCVVFTASFPSCPSGFTSSGPNNDWQCGVPSGSSGPPGDHTTGTGSLWGTQIGGQANTCEDSALVSPTLDLSPYAGKTVLLSFWHWFDFRGCTPNGIICPSFACQLDPTSYSGGVVEALVNGTWMQINPVGGYANGGQTISCAYTDAACTTCSLDGLTGFTADGMEGVWQEAVFDVSAYASTLSSVRFKYASHDVYSCYPKTGGWYIDDVEIHTVEPCP